MTGFGKMITGGVLHEKKKLMDSGGFMLAGVCLSNVCVCRNL